MAVQLDGDPPLPPGDLRGFIAHGRREYRAVFELPERRDDQDAVAARINSVDEPAERRVDRAVVGSAGRDDESLTATILRSPVRQTPYPFAEVERPAYLDRSGWPCHHSAIALAATSFSDWSRSTAKCRS